MNTSDVILATLNADEVVLSSYNNLKKGLIPRLGMSGAQFYFCSL